VEAFQVRTLHEYLRQIICYVDWVRHNLKRSGYVGTWYDQVSDWWHGVNTFRSSGSSTSMMYTDIDEDERKERIE
jgi:hypothetical protein